MRSLGMVLKAGLVLCLVGGAAWADALKFTASLEPETPTSGKGKGTATLSVDTATKTLTWTIAYSGLSAPPAIAAFLSPPPQPNGNPVSLPIPFQPGATSPIKGTMQLNDAQITGLKTGEWMLLIGSQKAPEIGGEVKPSP